jgi:hypothetical protein
VRLDSESAAWYNNIWKLLGDNVFGDYCCTSAVAPCHAPEGVPGRRLFGSAEWLRIRKGCHTVPPMIAVQSSA